MLDKLVQQTIYISLFVQVVTTLVSLDGFSLQLRPSDKILQEILWIETIVQLVEGIFYVWIISSLKNLDKMTPRRYIDWNITTPIMLLSTIIYFRYNELNQHGGRPFTALEFYEDNKENIQKIFVYNFFMLLFGFLGEAGYMDKRIAIPVGFIFFYLSFELVYREYGSKTRENKQLYLVLLVLWSMYGIAAVFPVKPKNISYNTLDVFAKNFYGLFIYYKIRELSVS